MAAKKLKVLIASPEVVPFAKTGGLADVAGALPKALEKFGLDVRVILPKYRIVDENRFNLKQIASKIKVPISDRTEECSLYEGRTGVAVPVYFIKKDSYFDRDQLYGTPEGDYPDNAERFVFFSRAILEIIKQIDFKPDVIHCNDWQTALICVYLETLYRNDPFFSDIASIFTVHNLGYQGLFWHYDMHLTQLGWDVFTPAGIEYYGKINFLKGGLVFADIINTVSKTYAREIQTPEFGSGLDGVLKWRSKDLYGIINGVDYDLWNPATDPQIPRNYDLKSLDGKRECKRKLREQNNLEVNQVPLIGMITRLADQKGLDLIAEIIDEIMSLELQFVLLGTGEEKYHRIFEEVASRYKGKAGINIGYDAQLAQRIYAGSDMFLMPSRYEPCGLGQLISLRYGTIPIVRKTGGLADTIQSFNSKTNKGNGFSFTDYLSKKLLLTIKKAISTYKDKKAWNQLIKNAMQEDYSWERSAKEYIRLYSKAIKKATTR